MVVHPPVEVIRPRAAGTAPPERGLPGGVQYTIKSDGLRIVAFSMGGGRAVLQSRSGADRARDFPAVAEAIAALPTGWVLDGELCAWKDQAFAFTELLRTRSARERAGTALSYIAFDAVAAPGHDVREAPLSERWELLREAVGSGRPSLETVMATASREEALSWAATLAPIGVEGLVCRGWATRYRPHDPRSRWIKWRWTETQDADVVALVGNPARPRAVLLELADGRRIFSSPRLTGAQQRQVAETASGRLGPAARHDEYGKLWPVDPPLLAEVQASQGRHVTVRFVRLRGD